MNKRSMLVLAQLAGGVAGYAIGYFLLDPVEVLAHRLFWSAVLRLESGWSLEQIVLSQTFLKIAGGTIAGIVLGGIVGRRHAGEDVEEQAPEPDRRKQIVVLAASALAIIGIAYTIVIGSRPSPTPPLERAVATYDDERAKEEREEAGRRVEVARNPPIRFEKLEGEWVTDYGGARKLAVSGTMVNVLGEPLEYACKSSIVVYVRGKAQVYKDESELGVSGCSDPGTLGVGKSKNFSNSAYEHPAVTPQMLEYTIDRVEWSFEVTAYTPLGAIYTWIVANHTVPTPSAKRKFALLESSAKSASAKE